MEDEKIVELYFERNESAIERTSEKYGKRLRAVSNGILKDIETAEECENDTYLEAWNIIPPNEPKTYFYAFLARIIRNISLNCCRKKNALKRNAFVCELSAEMEECIPSPDDMDCRIDDMVFAEIINKFLSELDAEKRKIFVRRYWYMDSVTEISEKLLLSESKVKTSLFRTRKKLREFLEKEGYAL
ncbi:MAG: sigma-70 family RNA polymerase sigma factor [Oscillospiraceae bacterium]|nr:sigma-70 family RNA polymerase sigma factor [Oscillospiraceae bacterium]